MVIAWLNPRRWCLAALLGVLAGLPLAAQAGGRRPFALLGPEQGLPSGAVICMAQDRDGFLWLGTENGLLRYEGHRCQHWSLDDGLPSAYVYQVVADPKGGVWVATLRGLVHLKDGRVTLPVFGPDPPQTPALLVALDAKGRLWATDRQHLYIQSEGLQFQMRPERLMPSAVTLTLGDQSGAMYLAGPQGLQAFLPDGTVRRYGPDDGLPPEGTVLVVEDGQGRLWTGEGRRLVMRPPGASRFQDRSSLLPASLTVSGFTLRDTDGSIWLPTQAGALHLSGAQREVLDARVGLPFRWVRVVFRDQEGTLWVLGPALAHLLGGGKVRNYTLSHGAFGEVVWYITQDLQGRLLVATDNGAARMGPQGLASIPGTEGGRIKGLAMDRDGTLWMVTTTGPTLWLRPGASKAVVAPLGPLGSLVNTVFQDHQGRVWLGSTHAGVLRWDPASRRLVQEASPAFTRTASLGAYAFSEDAQGRLWVGTTAGLLIRETDGHWRLFTAKDGLKPYTVYGAAFLPDGSAWLYYQEPEGLTRIRLVGDRLQILERLTKGHGLRTGLLYAVAVDPHGRTWLTTDQGLMGLDPPVHLGRDAGMASEDCAILALRALGGRIWVGTADGLVSYDADTPEWPLGPPRTFLTDGTVGGRPLALLTGTLGPIPSRQATVSFRFAAPSYARERDLRFQVRLVGLENAWRDTQGHAVRYPALPSGHYRFEVRTARGEGPFGPPATLAFTVLAPWWKTWWAVSGGLFLILAGLYALFRLRLANLAQAKADLEAEVAQRTQELQARNQELSEALANVKQLSGLLPICASCKKIRDDKGYWNQLEHYISDHSSADFTHGICPDCAKELYPGATRHRQEG